MPVVMGKEVKMMAKKHLEDNGRAKQKCWELHDGSSTEEKKGCLSKVRAALYNRSALCMLVSFE